jgi:hypothetical protein
LGPLDATQFMHLACDAQHEWKTGCDELLEGGERPLC